MEVFPIVDELCLYNFLLGRNYAYKAFYWIRLIFPVFLLIGKWWNFLDVLARFLDTLYVYVCLSCLPTRDALLYPWSMERLQCWRLPGLWHLASESLIPSKSKWSWCFLANSRFHHLNSGSLLWLIWNKDVAYWQYFLLIN